MLRDLCCSAQQTGCWSRIVISMVINIRSVTLCVCLALLSAQAVFAQEAFRYREFQLGSDLASIAKLTGTPAANAKVM